MTGLTDTTHALLMGGVLFSVIARDQRRDHHPETNQGTSMLASNYYSLPSLLAASMLGMAAMASPGGLGTGMPSSSIVSPRSSTKRREARRGDGALAAINRYPNGPGWGIRQVKRMAKKRKNVLANRRNHRG
jgi:hypothetical protein